jgi:hypothetical protein
MTVWERAYIEAESKKLLSCRTESELTGVSSGFPKEEFTLKHFLHRRYRNTAHALHIPSGMTVSKWVYVLRKQNLKKYVVMPGRSCNGKCEFRHPQRGVHSNKNIFFIGDTGTHACPLAVRPV